MAAGIFIRQSHPFDVVCWDIGRREVHVHRPRMAFAHRMHHLMLGYALAGTVWCIEQDELILVRFHPAAYSEHKDPVIACSRQVKFRRAAQSFQFTFFGSQRIQRRPLHFNGRRNEGVQPCMAESKLCNHDLPACIPIFHRIPGQAKSEFAAAATSLM